MQENTNLFKIKLKVTLIALSAIIFVVALFVISVVEIKKINDLKSNISQQQQELSNLQNKKGYYNSSNYEENLWRDNEDNYGNTGDLIFTEE